MKKIFCIPLLCMMLMALCACGDSGVAIEPDGETFVASFINDCDSEIYGVHYEYYLGDEAQGGGSVINANGSAIAGGDKLLKDFMAKDFSEPEDIGQFRLELYICDENGDEYPCGTLDWAAKFGEKYAVILSGSYETGFLAKLDA